MKPAAKMLPAGTPRWYDGEPKRPPKTIIKRSTLHTAIWLTLIVLSNPNVQVDHNGS